MPQILESRRYQVRAQEAFPHWYNSSGSSLATIILPTGCGKTYTAAMCLNTVPNKKILWTAHREELIDQAHEALSHVMPSANISIEMAERKADPLSNIVVGSVQTVSRARKHLDGFEPDIIVIDEYHHYSEENVQYDGLLKRWPKAKVLGLTATPWRFSGEVLPLGRVLIQMDIGTAIDKKYLVPPKAESLITGVSLSEVKTRMGDFATKDLSKAVNVESRNKMIAKRIIELVRDGKRQGILFAVDVEHSKAMYELLRNEVRAAEVYGETPVEERRRLMQRIRNGEIDVLCNNLVATEGFDVKHLSFVTMARPTKSLGLYQQCLDSHTEILTKRGFLKVDDLHKSDLVAAFNVNNSAITWEKIVNITDRTLQANEEMYEYISPHLNIRVTDGHRMIWRARHKRRKGKHSWDIQEARNLFEIKDQYDIPVSGQENAPGIPLSDDEIRFIGWFLTDGCLNKHNNQITITQAIHQPHLSKIEECLNGCNFKHSKNKIVPNGFPNGREQVKFCISKGKPRGTRKDLTGWGRLSKYIDKNLSENFENINERQFDILLEAIHLGDGDKQVNKKWTRRSYHISTGNLIFANNLQSLAIRRGWAANITQYVNTNGNPIYKIHLKKIQYRSVCGSSYIDRPRLIKSCKTPGERVWCVENAIGTIIIRRSGRTAIVGNCIGRGLRTSPETNKADCIILDVHDKVKVKQSRVTFVDMAAAGDIYGDKKRSSNILKAEVPVEEVSKTLKNFPIMINKNKADRWTIDDESFSVSAWVVGTDQWIVTWTAETKEPKIISTAVYVPWTELPPITMDVHGRSVQHPTFGQGKVLSIVDRDNPKILVEFSWGDRKTMDMNSLLVQKYVKEYSPSEIETVKTDKLFFVCTPDSQELGRVIHFVKYGRDLILKEDKRISKLEIDTYLQGEAMKDGILQLVRTNAKWKFGPASDKQKSYVEKMADRVGFDIDLDTLSKGDASAIIEQVKWQDIIHRKFGTDYKEKLLGYDVELEDV